MRALAQATWSEGIPDCTRCVEDPGLRAAFGCDAPAGTVVFKASCSEHGKRCPKTDAISPKCKSGERYFYRCPRKLVDGQPTLERALRAFIFYDEHGTLPAAGGLLDQTATCVAAFEVFRSEKIQIENARAEAAQREQARQQMLQRKGGGRSRGGRR